MPASDWCLWDHVYQPQRVPADLKTVKLKKGASLAMTNGTLQLLKWKDKRDVHMFTTVHTTEFIDVQGRVDRTTGQAIQPPTTL